MPESFFHLSAKEQEEALQVAASASGRPAHLLENDIWVVWALSMLFTSPLGAHLAFKGGTASQKHTKRYAGFQRMWTSLTTSGRSRHNLSGMLLTDWTRFLRAGARRKSGPINPQGTSPSMASRQRSPNRASRTGRTSGGHKPRHGWMHIH
jgi:hypothetical protein